MRVGIRGRRLLPQTSSSYCSGQMAGGLPATTSTPGVSPEVISPHSSRWHPSPSLEVDGSHFCREALNPQASEGHQPQPPSSQPQTRPFCSWVSGIQI